MKNSNPPPKRGRPARSANGLPAWAQKRIAEIARAAGASEKKVLELSLQAGLIEVEELYQPIITYSANLKAKTHHETKPTAQATATIPEPVLEPDFEEPLELDPYSEPEESVEPRTDNALKRSDSPEETDIDFEDVSPEADRITPGYREPRGLEEVTPS